MNMKNLLFYKNFKQCLTNFIIFALLTNLSNSFLFPPSPPSGGGSNGCR